MKPADGLTLGARVVEKINLTLAGEHSVKYRPPFLCPCLEGRRELCEGSQEAQGAADTAGVAKAFFENEGDENSSCTPERTVQNRLG